MKRLIHNIILVPWLLVLGLHAGAAQDMLRAAAVVNDEIISMLDLDMRMRLAILATGQKDTAELRDRIVPQVIRGLIDERLRSQEAERLDIKVADEQVSATVEDIARRNKMTVEDFKNLLKSRGILQMALRQQVRAQLVWRTLISRRLRPSVTISDDEVEEVVSRITANRGSTQRLVSEIFLSVDSVLYEDEVRRNATRLFEQVRAGADFAAVAREFSESATTARGGDLGWVQEGQLPEELDRALATMKPGSLSIPVRTLSGYHILFLRDHRQISLGKVTLNLKQILLALPDNASAEQLRQAAARASEMRPRINGCAGLDELAGELGSPGSGDLGTLKLGDLPATIRDAVKGLPIGKPSAPIKVPGGISVLVVCERVDSGVDRKRIRDRLIGKRLDILSRRYMRDLRRSANVDIRI